ncbi:MAG: hypothetical protein ACREOY_14730 [Candidatus Dormibacteraceae bacterium]
MKRPPGDTGFVVNVAITVLATLAIGSIAYAGMVRALHPVAVALPAASPSPSRGSSSTASPEPPAPSPIPTPRAGTPPVALVDLDLTDSSTGWILLSSCAAITIGTCDYFVAGTLDAGATWTKPIQVGPAFDRTDGGGPTAVRFLNHMDGFVYGSSGAYVTHDGGRTWAGAGLPGKFIEGMAAGGQTVWAATSPCGKGLSCQLEIRHSVDGGRSWLAPHALPLGFSPEELVPFAAGVIMSSVPLGDIQMTTDGGLTWRSIKSQCARNPFRGYVATSDGVELWELCMGYPDPNSNTADKTVFVSEDSGKSWKQRATSLNGGVLQQSGFPAWFVSNRSRVAFMSGAPTPVVTHDTGATWTPVGLDGTGLWLIRFAGSHDGWALEGTRNIWVTTDGGETWSQEGRLPNGVG